MDTDGGWQQGQELPLTGVGALREGLGLGRDGMGTEVAPGHSVPMRSLCIGQGLGRGFLQACLVRSPSAR